MKFPNVSMSVLMAVAAMILAAPAQAQRDYYDDERYEDSRYEDESRYDEDDYEYRRYEEPRYDDARPRYDIARVIDVEPIVDTTPRPVQREECRQQPLPRRAEAPAESRGILASVLQTPSTQAKPTTTRRCTTRTEYVRDERITGYDVAYRWRGRTYYTVTSRDPGDTIRIELE